MPDQDVLRNRPLWLNLDYDREPGPLLARVLETDRDFLVVSTPYRQGRPVPLLPGEQATVHVPYNAYPGRYTYEFRTQILQRRSTPIPAAVIRCPADLVRIIKAAEPRQHRVVAVASGKGGTGKSTVALNLGLALAARGRRVSLVDADLGTANLGAMLGLEPQVTLEDVARGSRHLSEAVHTLPDNGLMLVPAGAGVPDLATLNRWQFGRLLDALRWLEDQSDVVLLDLSAGISRLVTTFVNAADQVLVVATPEPHALTGAFALLTALDLEGGPRVRVLLNQVSGPVEAGDAFRRLDGLARERLGTRLGYLGHIPADPHVARAVRRQVAPFLDNPLSPASQALARLAERVEDPLATARPPESRWTFVQRLMQSLSHREGLTAPAGERQS